MYPSCRPGVSPPAPCSCWSIQNNSPPPKSSILSPCQQKSSKCSPQPNPCHSPVLCGPSFHHTWSSFDSTRFMVWPCCSELFRAVCVPFLFVSILVPSPLFLLSLCPSLPPPSLDSTRLEFFSPFLLPQTDSLSLSICQPRPLFDAHLLASSFTLANHPRPIHVGLDFTQSCLHVCLLFLVFLNFPIKLPPISSIVSPFPHSFSFPGNRDSFVLLTCHPLSAT